MSKIHQDIETNSVQGHVIRQSRFNDCSMLKLLIDSKSDGIVILNYSTFGIAFITPLSMQIGEIVENCEIYLFGKKFISFTGCVKRVNKISDNSFEVGLEFIDNTIDVSLINVNHEIQTKLSDLFEKENRYSKLSASIKNIINELSLKFKKLEKIAKSFETNQFENSKQKQLKFETLIVQLGDVIYEELKNANDQIQPIFFKSSDDDKKLILEMYRENLSEYVLQSSFTNRSYTKPRGYAGDFEMMNLLYKNDNFSNTLFGSCVENAVNKHAEPEAVRNRSEYLKSKILNKIKSNKLGKLKILSVACGPAEEIKLALKTLSNEELQDIDFYLLDQDMDALLYAQKQIKDEAMLLQKNIKINLLNKSIKEVILSGINYKFDLIYSAGLFDYFTDAVASRACKSLFTILNSEGTLIIGNFNMSSPNWFGMLALFDWFLILRSEQDLKRIFKVDGVTSINIESEQNNVNLFCNINKK